MCGEHREFVADRRHARGSSPRVRGTRRRQAWRTTTCGIIPACAGNTSHAYTCPTFHRDHPRVCGEHPLSRIIRPATVGSSPRVRGTPVSRRGRLAPAGIIPACAGNTSTTRAKHCRPRDHPRVCGEHTASGSMKHAVPGSSPRVRGTRDLAELQRAALGIIPACAGNTELSLAVASA